jgi:tetratricopeptide (TPR) repeat protein
VAPSLNQVGCSHTGIGDDKMAGEYNQEIPLTKAAAIFTAAAAVVVILCIAIGEAFFWDRYDTIDPVDKDIAYYSRISAEQPDNDNALVELGWRYYRKGNFQEAVKALEKAAELNRSNVAAHFNLALSYKEMGLLGKAEEEFNRVITLEEDHKLVPFYMGKMYLEQRRYDDAIKHLQRAVQLDPVSADGHYLLGSAYAAKGHNEEALAAFERCLQLAPGHEEARAAANGLE